MVSLIIATINRPKEIMACVESALKQSGDFEIIVVDQGARHIVYPEDDRLRVVYIKKHGLSHARNIGLQNAVGDLIVYVDDDATISTGYFKVLEMVFSDREVDGIAGRILLEGSNRSYAKSQKNKSKFLRQDEWSCVLGGNLAFRRSTLEVVGCFDRRFGVGTEWGSAEDADYFFRMCYSGKKMFYAADMVIYHPLEAVGHSLESLNEKYYSYGSGHGALFAKHWIEHGMRKHLLYFIWALIKPAVRMVQFMLICRLFQVRKHYFIACGRCNGFYSFIMNSCIGM